MTHCHNLYEIGYAARHLINAVYVPNQHIRLALFVALGYNVAMTSCMSNHTGVSLHFRATFGGTTNAFDDAQFSRKGKIGGWTGCVSI